MSLAHPSRASRVAAFGLAVVAVLLAAPTPTARALNQPEGVVNYIDGVWPTSGGTNPAYVTGSDTNISIILTPKGTGSVGIATTSPQSLLHVYGGEVQVGSSGASCAAANGGALRYATNTVYYCNGSNWITVAAGGSLPALTNDYLWVGNASNVATAVQLSQDVTITNAGVATVGKIQNVAVGSPTGTAGSAVVLATSPTISAPTLTGTTAGANLTLSGTETWTPGSDYSTTGAQNNVSLGTVSAVRYTGAGTATFTGIVAGSNLSGQAAASRRPAGAVSRNRCKLHFWIGAGIWPATSFHFLA